MKQFQMMKCVFIGQISVLLAMSVVFLIVRVDFALASLWLGGAVALLPYYAFAWRVFKHSGATQAKAIYADFYRGELTKFVLTAVLFSLVFKYLQINVMAFFSGYIAMHLVHWLSPWLIAREVKAV